MINGKKIVVVLPAYNAGKTLMKTYQEIPRDIVDSVILVDDCSQDETFELAKAIGIPFVIRHSKNTGYGGNQKTCYENALAIGADIVVMVHPDYQYTPQLIASMCFMIAYEVYPVVLGSRILGKSALRGGMPLYKYVSNRALTFVQNILMGQKLSEYHTGFRAYSSVVLRTIPFHRNSDGFIFDNQAIAQIFDCGFDIGEVSCPTRYFPEASSISFKRSVVYGMGVLSVSFSFAMKRLGIYVHPIFRRINVKDESMKFGGERRLFVTKRMNAK